MEIYLLLASCWSQLHKGKAMAWELMPFQEGGANKHY